MTFCSMYRAFCVVGAEVTTGASEIIPDPPTDTTVRVTMLDRKSRLHGHGRREGRLRAPRGGP